MHIAKTMLAEFGQALVGKNVITKPRGPWPGGLATVTELAPDGNAPEIVFNIRHAVTGEEIGVFDDDMLGLPGRGTA